MLKNVPASITNNIIAIVISIYVGFVLGYPLTICIWWATDGIFLWLETVLYTIIAFGLYFFSGRVFLRNTENTQTDLFSVIAVTIVLFVSLYLWEGIIFYFPALPLYMLGVLISSIFQIPFEVGHFIPLFGQEHTKYVFMVLSPLPTLSMWAGMRAKRYANTLFLQQQQSTSKKKFASIVLNKYLALFIFLSPILLVIFLFLLICFIFCLAIIYEGIDFILGRIF